MCGEHKNILLKCYPDNHPDAAKDQAESERESDRLAYVLATRAKCALIFMDPLNTDDMFNKADYNFGGLDISRMVEEYKPAEGSVK